MRAIGIISLLLTLAELSFAESSPTPAANAPYISFKITQVVRARKKPFATLKLRFSCAEGRYSAWIVSTKGVRSGVGELRFNNTTKTFLPLQLKSARVLAIEDATEDSEKSFFPRLKNTKRIQVIYLDGAGTKTAAEFMTKGVYDKIEAAAKQCAEE